MKKYFPVIFTKEDVGFSTVAVDLDGCFSEGDSFDESYINTQDAIGLYLDGMSDFPEPSNPVDVASGLSDEQFMCVVEFDDLEYKKRNSKRAVKKRLPFPNGLTMKQKNNT